MATQALLRPNCSGLRNAFIQLLFPFFFFFIQGPEMVVNKLGIRSALGGKGKLGPLLGLSLPSRDLSLCLMRPFFHIKVFRVFFKIHFPILPHFQDLKLPLSHVAKKKHTPSVLEVSVVLI